MYSLFLCTSALSYLALLHALDRGGRRRWALWAVAILATVATHPYGALVLATQAVFVLVARRERLRRRSRRSARSPSLGIPFWLTDLVLAGRFDVGVGGGGEKLGGPLPVFEYLWEVGSDFSAGFPVLPARARARRSRGRAALARGAAARGGGGGRAGRRLPRRQPRQRDLARDAAPDLRRSPSSRSSSAPVVARLGRVGPFRRWRVLVTAQVAWAWDETPRSSSGSPTPARRRAPRPPPTSPRTSRPDDVLFGFEPLYLGAWERNADFPLTVLPRADAKLALSTLRDIDRPIGRGVWILDASETNNGEPSLHIALRHRGRRRSSTWPGSARSSSSARAGRPSRRSAISSGPARRCCVGKALYIGDADINLVTIERAARELGATAPPSRSRPARGSRAPPRRRRGRGVSRRAPSAAGGPRRAPRTRRRPLRRGTSAFANGGIVVHGRIVGVIVTLGDLLLDVIVRLEQPLAESADADAVTRLGAGGQAANVAAWVAELGGERSLRRQARRGRRGRGGGTRGSTVTASKWSGPSWTGAPAPSSRSSAPTAAGRWPPTAASRPTCGRTSSSPPGWTVASTFTSPATRCCARRSTRRRCARPSWRLVSASTSPRGARSATSARRGSASGSRRCSRRSCSRTRTRSGSSAGRCRGCTWILKRGALGARFGDVELPALPADVVDSTGAGDALAAGYLVGGPELALEAAARCVAQLGSMP